MIFLEKERCFIELDNLRLTKIEPHRLFLFRDIFTRFNGLTYESEVIFMQIVINVLGSIAAGLGTIWLFGITIKYIKELYDEKKGEKR